MVINVGMTLLAPCHAHRGRGTARSVAGCPVLEYPQDKPLQILTRSLSSTPSHMALSCRSILPTENAGAAEVFVDQIEVISATMSAAGDVVTAACHGTLQMKSYLAHDGLSAMLKMQSFHCTELASQYPFMNNSAGVYCFLEDLQLHQEAQLQPTCAPPALQSAHRFGSCTVGCSCGDSALLD